MGPHLQVWKVALLRPNAHTRVTRLICLKELEGRNSVFGLSWRLFSI